MAVPVAEPARAGPRLGMALGLAAGAGLCLGVLWAMRRRSQETERPPRRGTSGIGRRGGRVEMGGMSLEYAQWGWNREECG